jgi:hypothetical protein
VSLVGLAAGLASAAVFGVAAVAQAGTARGYDEASDRIGGFWVRALRDARMWAVVMAYYLGFVLHAVAIWLLPLYFAQALVSLSLPMASLASGRVDGRLGARRWASVGLVTLGLVLLALGAGEPGSVVTEGSFAVALWAGVAVLALTSTVGARLGGPALGLLAGLGYAGSAIAVRGVGLPVESAVIWAAIAVPSFSVVAFWLYSLGMRRTTVSSVTASMIVVQTFLPAAIGIALLGDAVRPGWAGSVALGLALATTGAVFLSRSQPDHELLADSAPQ